LKVSATHSHFWALGLSPSTAVVGSGNPARCPLLSYACFLTNSENHDKAGRLRPSRGSLGQFKCFHPVFNFRMPAWGTENAQGYRARKTLCSGISTTRFPARAGKVTFPFPIFFSPPELEMEPRALCTLGKSPTTEPHPHPCFLRSFPPAQIFHCFRIAFLKGESR
jgi:hypothetical protein